MIAQGSALVNTAYFEQLKAEIDGIRSCAELQQWTQNTYASLTATMDGAASQLAVIEPIMQLLTSPEANPTAIVNWITSFITAFLTPYVKPYATYAAMLVAIVAAAAEIESAIQNKSSLFASCSVTVPGLPTVSV